MKIVSKAETPAVDTKNSTTATSVNPISEVAATSASHVKPVVRITDSYDIVISGLPVASQKKLDNSAFRRICHALKHRYMDEGYIKHDTFLRRLNHGKAVTRPKHMPSVCICYMLGSTYIAEEASPQLVIKFTPSVSFPSAHIKCSDKDPRRDYQTYKIRNGEPVAIHWRALSKEAIEQIVQQFSKTCARLIEARIDLVWNNTPDDRTPTFY